MQRQTSLKSKSSVAREPALTHTVQIAQEKERFDNSLENRNSGKLELPEITIRQHEAVPDVRPTSKSSKEAISAHNLHVAKEKEREQQMRLRRLHQFLYEEMAERDEKAKKERSIHIFKERKKNAIFLNYELRYVGAKSIFNMYNLCHINYVT